MWVLAFSNLVTLPTQGNFHHVDGPLVSKQSCRMLHLTSFHREDCIDDAIGEMLEENFTH